MGILIPKRRRIWKEKPLEGARFPSFVASGFLIDERSGDPFDHGAQSEGGALGTFSWFEKAGVPAVSATVRDQLCLSGARSATTHALVIDFTVEDHDLNNYTGYLSGGLRTGTVTGNATDETITLGPFGSGDYRYVKDIFGPGEYTLVLWFDGQDYQFSVNGSKLAAFDGAGGGITYLVDTTISGSGKGYSGSRRVFYKSIYIIDQPVDDDFAVSLSENPYQILKPRRKFWVVPSATDTTAPILSSPTGTKTGSTTADGTVSTDEANGTLYYLASENATETAATIKAGSSQAVTATGVQNVSFTGLTPSTLYYAHYVHDDAAINESNVQTSASFTTDAASSVIAIFRRRIEGQGNAFR